MIRKTLLLCLGVMTAALISLSACANRAQHNEPQQVELKETEQAQAMQHMHEQVSIWNTDLADASRFKLDHKLSSEEKSVARKFARTVIMNLKNNDVYVHYLLSKLKEMDLPIELAAIPLIESGLNPHVKPNGGAHGAWQYVRSTANTLGLKRSGNYDGIYDFFACTDASLKYLKRLYDDLGQWELVAAAYNQGEYGVKRLMSQARNAGVKPTYENIRLSRQVRAYITKFRAFSDVLLNPQQYGVNLPEIKNRPSFRRVDVNGKVNSMSQAAKLSGADLEALKKLNSGYIGDRIDDMHGLLMPIEHAESLENAIRDNKVSAKNQSSNHK